MKYLLLLCLVLSASACASRPAHTAATPTRDEYRSAIYLAVYGLNAGLKTCQTVSMAYAENGDTTKASMLVDLCTDGIQLAADAQAVARGSLSDWDAAESPGLIACAIRPMVPVYARMVRMLKIVDSHDEDVIDGAARVAWLSKQCKEGT